MSLRNLGLFQAMSWIVLHSIFYEQVIFHCVDRLLVGLSAEEHLSAPLAVMSNMVLDMCEHVFSSEGKS